MTDPDLSSRTVQQIEKENVRLRRAVEELSILNDLAREIGASLNSEEIMRKVIHRSLRAVHAEQGDISLVERQQAQTMKTLVRSMVSSSAHEPFHLHQNLLGWMHLNKKPLLMNEPHLDPRFRGLNWDESIRSLLCVPLLSKSELIGILTVYNKKGETSFTEEDLRLLAIIAGQSAQVVENARLYEEEQTLFRMREELRLAKEIQLGLLPSEIPQVSGYDIAAISIPAQVVGGDYFDVIEIDESRLATCLGDVSGKGLPAALLMANLQATIRGQTLVNCSPQECLCRSNKLLYRSTAPQKFATFFYGILNRQTHEYFYANAGHDRPLLFSRGKEPAVLPQAGLALSFLENIDYEQCCFTFNPGDLLLIHSDGITEAMDTEEEEFGAERLAKIVESCRQDSATVIIDQVISAVNNYIGDQAQMDDMTVVVVKRLAE